MGWSWPPPGRERLPAPLRYLAHTIDIVLLTAALMLMSIVHQYPVADTWLTVKALLLIVYIGLGVFAFRAQPSLPVRLGAWAAGLVVFGYIYSVAVTRNPFGIAGALLD